MQNTNTDDRWACEQCGSEAIDGFQGHWVCLDCGAEWQQAEESVFHMPDPVGGGMPRPGGASGSEMPS